ncbi:unnamed protein product [Arctia plantaginis]|nr:unnamed protein product [Arctia plantaginis]
MKDLSECKNTPFLSVKDFCEPTSSSSTRNDLTEPLHTLSQTAPDSIPNSESGSSTLDVMPTGPRNNKKGGRKAGRSIIATDTLEKNALAEHKNKKKIDTVKKVTKNLFKGKENSCKRRKRNVTPVEASDDENKEFQPSGSSSDKDDIVLKDDFPALKP